MYRTAEIGYEGRSGRGAAPEHPEVRIFQSLTVSAVRTVVSRHADKAGMDPARKNDLVLAVNEVAANSVVHAGGWGILLVWREAESMICEIRDRGTPGWTPAAPVQPEPDQLNGYGLWLADQLCERVDVSASDGGTVVRLQMPLR